jgi:60 kDa SS-A/Ro ribonucleoprotein
LTEWQTFAANQQRLGVPAPKLIIDLQPCATTQTPERDDILNIGGINDAVFNVVASFLSADVHRFVAEVESIEL